MMRKATSGSSRRDGGLASAVAFAFRLARVRDFAHFALAPLIPLATGPFEGARVLKGLLAGIFCLAFAYAWNEFKDEIEPSLNGREPLARFGLAARVFVTLSALVALGIAASVGPVSFAAACVSLAVSYLYSGGPRLKRYPVVGTLTNAVIFVPVAFLGIGGPEVSSTSLLLIVAYGLLVLQVQVVHEFAHLDEDREAGIVTTARRYGVRVGAVLLGFLGFLAGVSLAANYFAYEPRWVFLAAPVPLWAATAWTLARSRLSPAPAAAASRLVLRYSGLASGAVAWLALLVGRL